MSSRRYMILYKPGHAKKSKRPMGLLVNVMADFNSTFKRLAWESQKSAKLVKDDSFIEFGLEKDLTDYISQGLPGFKRLSDNKIQSVRGGFVIELGNDGDCVHTATIAIGRMNLSALAGLCKQRGWRFEDPDAESNSEVDLNDSEGWFVEHYG